MENKNFLDELEERLTYNYNYFKEQGKINTLLDVISIITDDRYDEVSSSMNFKIIDYQDKLINKLKNKIKEIESNYPAIH